MAGSWLDMALKDALYEHFRQIPNFKPGLVDDLISKFNADLGTFAARTLAARVLDLISDETYSATNALRDLRNAYSHKPFNTELTQAGVDSVLNKFAQKTQTSIKKTVQGAIDKKTVGGHWRSREFSPARIMLMEIALVLFRSIAKRIEEYRRIENPGYGIYFP